MAINRLHLVRFGSSTYLGGNQSVDFSDGEASIRPMGDGIVDPKFISTVGQNARVSVGTLAIKSMLTAVGFGTATGAFYCWDARITESAGGKSASANCNSYTAAESRSIPRSLTVAGNGNAVGVVEVIPYSSTGGNSVAVSTSASLPAQAIASNEVFGMGPVEINGTEITGKQDVGVTFGIQEFAEQAEGNVAPRNVEIVGRMPSIVIRTIDVGLRSLIPVGGLEITTATIAFRRRKHGAAYYADGDSEHVLLTIAEGMVHATETTGDPRMLAIVIEPVAGSAASIQLGLGVALT